MDWKRREAAPVLSISEPTEVKIVDETLIEEELRNELYGKGNHVHVLDALEGLDTKTAGATMPGMSHSIHQILRHMIYWLEIALARIEKREHDPAKKAADGWLFPAEPGEGEWAEAVERLASGLRSLGGHFSEMHSVDPEHRKLVRRSIRMVMVHNAYHLGQIVTLREQFNRWPPPKGGDTW